MRLLLGVLVSLTLLLAGCTPPATQSQATSASATGAAKGNFDALANTKKLVMSTKITSDMPNSWEFDGADAANKMQKLLAVLNQGTPMQNGAVDSQHVVPTVMFIIDDAKGNKNVINVYDDRFQYGSNWYALKDATDRTYGAINQLQEKFDQ